ncbi:hypothetical protein GCM10010193_62280 [Kitasatospora atroaurantiaca]
MLKQSPTVPRRCRWWQPRSSSWTSGCSAGQRFADIAFAPFAMEVDVDDTLFGLVRECHGEYPDGEERWAHPARKTGPPARTRPVRQCPRLQATVGTTPRVERP